jgi:hypothetical protein
MSALEMEAAFLLVIGPGVLELKGLTAPGVLELKGLTAPFLFLLPVSE